MNRLLRRLTKLIHKKDRNSDCINERITKEMDNTLIEVHVLLEQITDGNQIYEKYKKVCEKFGNRVRITNASLKKAVSTSYIYEPKTKAIDENQFFQAMFCLLHQKYDFLIVSNTLDNYPMCGGDSIEDVVILNQKCHKAFSENHSCPADYTGRMLRIPGHTKTTNLINLEQSFQKYQLCDEYILKTQGSKEPWVREIEWSNAVKKNKPVVFVMPIFMAVGGVERNTIEMMRALKDDYTFCVITMERHSKEQGSLHNQLEGLCDFVLDLREITEFRYYLSVLSELKQMYLPKVIWLCNNSPWFEENASAIRQIFWDVNIVAQDVYDTKYGWIAYYDRPSIQSFNHFIAINEKIKDTFMNQYKINEEKIEVIYSGIDDRRIREVLGTDYVKADLYEKYGLNPEKKHVALIGRMTEQKDPIRYLRMIQKVADQYPDYEFVMVGDGALGQQVQQYIEENGLTSKVVRIPYVQSTPELFMILDGLAITSVYEGLAIVSIEAMSLGVPILSTDTGDMKLFLDQTEGGYIIPESGDDEEAFKHWHDNYEQYKKNAMEHSNEILEFFSANHIAGQYKKLFDQEVLL